MGDCERGGVSISQSFLRFPSSGMLMLDNTDVILVYPDFDLIDASGTYVRNIETPDYDYRNMILYLLCYPGPGAIIWKNYFDVTDSLNQYLKQVSGFECWPRLPLHGIFKRIPKILASSRIHDDSQSFKVVTYKHAMESVDALVRLLGAGKLRLEFPEHSDRSLASVYMLSFGWPLRSRFYVASIKNLCKAISLRPGLIANSTFWKVVVPAFLGKIYNREKYST